MVRLSSNSYVNPDRVLCVVKSSSNPMKSRVNITPDEWLIDITGGKKRKSVIFLDTGHIILCPKEYDEVSKIIKNMKGDVDVSDNCECEL